MSEEPRKTYRIPVREKGVWVSHEAQFDSDEEAHRAMIQENEVQEARERARLSVLDLSHADVRWLRAMKIEAP